jgi:hypothetical protein
MGAAIPPVASAVDLLPIRRCNPELHKGRNGYDQAETRVGSSVVVVGDVRDLRGYCNTANKRSNEVERWSYTEGAPARSRSLDRIYQLLSQ